MQVAGGIELVLGEQPFQKQALVGKLLQKLLGQDDVRASGAASQWRIVLRAHDDGAFGLAELVLGEHVAFSIQHQQVTAA